MLSKSIIRFLPKVSPVAAAASLLLSVPNVNAQIPLVTTDNGWSVTMMGLFSVWTGAPSWDVGSARQDSFRVTTGFNPSKIEFLVNAPEHNGIKMSAYFQLATSLQGFKTRRTGEQIEVRAADIWVSGAFGQFQIGRSFAIFGSNAILNDPGSMRGTGYLCVGPDGSGPNCGHIGTGYTWSDWTAGIRYQTPRSKSGFQFRIGLFDPIETAFGFPGGDALVIGAGDLTGAFSGLFFNFTDIPGTGEIETDTPLIEADLTFTRPFGPNGNSNITLWLSGMTQNLTDLGTGAGDTDIQGFGVGGRLKFGNLGITANFEDTEGIAEGFMGFGVRCDTTGCGAVEGDQWYANIDYTAGNTVFGVSFGEGNEDANVIVGNADVERELTVVYIQHQLTPNFNINAEFHTFERTTAAGGAAAGVFQANEEYDAILFGGEFRF